MTYEEYILSLAENITIVMILSIVFGLVIGWYFTRLYYKSDPDDDDDNVGESQTKQILSPKRYRQLWRFVPVVQNIKVLQQNADYMTKCGYSYQPDASNAGVLAFMKYEEATEAKYPNELTDEEIINEIDNTVHEIIKSKNQ